MTETPLQFMTAPRIDLAIAEHASGSTIALAADGAEITYGELERYIRSAAAWLSGLVKDNEAIGVFMDNSPEAIVAILGAMRAGHIVVPINTKNDPGTVAYISKSANVGIVVVSERTVTRLADWKDGVPVKTLSIVDLSPADDVGRPLDQDSTAVIFFTSGSTGKPKGVMVTHRNLTHGVDSVAQYLNITPGKRLGAVLPVSFDAGLNWVLTGLCMGAEVHLLRYVFPRTLAAELEELSIEALLAVPTVFHALSGVPAPNNLKGLHMASTGGRMDHDAVAKLRASYDQLHFTVMYGLTEAFRATYLPDEMWSAFPTSVGRPIPHAEVHVLAEDGQPTKPGDVGEIVQSGPLVSQGYINAPDQQQLRFGPTPAFSRYADSNPVSVYSGDTGYVDENGLLYFVGRKDRLIKSRGFRIAPEEIEKEVVAKTDLEKVIAFGQDDPSVGQKIILVAEGAENEMTTLATVRKALRGNIPEYMLPDELHWIASFPLNPNGKFDVSEIIRLVSE